MKRWNDGWNNDWSNDWNSGGWKGKWEDKGKWVSKSGDKWERADSSGQTNAQWEERRPPKRSQRCEVHDGQQSRPKRLKGSRADFHKRWSDASDEVIRPKIPRPPKQEVKDSECEKGIFAWFRFFGGRT